MMELVLFFLLGATVLAGAVVTVLAKNSIHSAIGFMGTLLSLAILYVVNSAHLLGVVVVIVCAGTVMTLLLFVMMLVGVNAEEPLREDNSSQMKIVAGIGLGMLALGAVAAFTGQLDWFPGSRTVPQEGSDLVELAESLFTDWVLVFEATALLLATAVAGAIALAGREKKGRGS